MRVCGIVFMLVFFFKQKTAYDMRISDWSSDVCSSDLVQIGMAQARRLDLDQHLAPSGPVDLDVLDLECSGDPVEYRSLHGASPLIGDWMARKIGRASCRERVCQYV